MQFVKGMDVSMTKELEAYGARYYLNGQEEDLFRILKSCGTNMIRLRIWQDPYDEEGHPYGGGENDLETTIELAQRTRENGMEFLLDFHYSDFWADPGKQMKPKAWEGLTGEQLEAAVYLHTLYVLKTLKNHQLIPQMVQIGNEITNGFLWPDGYIGTTEDRDDSKDGVDRHDSENSEGREDSEDRRDSEDTHDGKGYHVEKMAALLSAGIRAVRKECPDAKIVLHLDFGTNNEMYRHWFDAIAPFGVDYDIIGMSYYPHWNGSLAQLLSNMNDVSRRYGKDVMIAETSIGYTTQDMGCKGIVYTDEEAKVTGYPASPEGQEHYLRDLCSTVRSVEGGHGIGIFYWEPAWIPVPECNWATPIGSAYMKDTVEAGNTMANQALFDKRGNANPALLNLASM